MPRHMPEALGKYVVIKDYLDANHAGNMSNRRSYYGIIIYVNTEPIIWYSKLQNRVEASSFISECVALRISTETIEDLRYKLRCFGIPVDGPAEVFCDNMSVVKNLSIPTSSLNKRHNVICYHRVKEAQDTGIVLVGWITGKCNLLDLFTKTTMPGNKRLIKYDLTQHHKLVILVRRRFICTWVHLSTSHTKRVVAEIGFWACIHILFKSIIYGYQFSGTR